MIVTMALMLNVSAFAAQGALKIGVIDVRKVVEQSKSMKALNKRIQSEFKPKQEKIVELQRSMQSKVDKMKREEAVMTAAEKSNLQEQVVAGQRSLQRMEQDYQQDLTLIQNKEMKKFFDSLKVTVDKFAKANGYDIVLQKEAVPFYSDKVDITNKIISKLS